jgi:hypothetical protein
MVERSSYGRGELKRRLFAAGPKEPVCEICGQGNRWLGKPMSMVLDHINGVSDNHRLENVRIVCPNCNATLDTHCGRNGPRERERIVCRRTFVPGHMQHRHCSIACVGAANGTNLRGVPRAERRKVERPPHDVPCAELAASGFLAAGR